MLKICLLFAVIALASASDVLVLTDSDFEDKVAEHDIILVEFYAPWCGHCKKLAPEYEEAATALKKNDPPVALAKVDCIAETKTCGKFGVSGYPTLKIFRSGEVAEEYNGPRQADGIVKTMRSKAGPSSKELKSAQEVEKFISGMDVAIVGVFESEGSDVQKNFQKVADSMNEDHKFGHTYNSDAVEKYGKDVIVLFRPKHLHSKFEDKFVTHTGDAAVHQMKSFIGDNVHGLAGHKTSSNQNQFKKPLVTAFYSVDYVKNIKGTNYWRNRVMKVAKKFVDDGKTVHFAVASKDEFSHELSEFGVDTTSDKPLITAKDAKDSKFVMKEEFSMDALEKFVNDLLDGNLKPYLKSEPVPENNDGPVKVIVAENFEEIVNDETKDVLIEFYAPWCGHCKNLAPKYEELGEKLQAETDIVIAKMDATANDVPPQYEVRGFPTIFFAPKNKKDSPKKYEGGREVDDFIKYIAREATDGLTHFTKDGKKKGGKKGKNVEL